jgi:hypothetical protein
MQNKLYEFTIKVSPGEGCSFPKNMDAAYVNCYSPALDHERAMKNGVIAIKQDNYIFEDIINNAREIPVEHWDEYIKETWPDFVGYLPEFEDVRMCVRKGMVFFSPFVGFKE